MSDPRPEPELLKAAHFDPSDIGTFEWNRKHNADELRVSMAGPRWSGNDARGSCWVP